MSATSIRSPHKPFDSSDRPSLRDIDSRDRYSFRGKAIDGESTGTREHRSSNLRSKRPEGEQDSDGWSTVKPRKSFGTEGAERFNGRMGLDRHREDKRFKDREEREVKDRPRGFDGFSRDKDVDHEQDREPRRNGNGRGRNEPSWFKDNKDNGDPPPPTPRDRNSNGDRYIDRSRGWREKERDDRGGDRGDRGDRRWDRDRDRQEREPEWMDEPVEEKSQARTLEDFQKWKDQMQGKDRVASGKTPAEESTPRADISGQGSFFGLEKQKVETPLAIDTGPDKFFGMWAHSNEDNASIPGVEPKREGSGPAKTSGKASRFTSFFTPHEEPARRQTEPPPPVPQLPLGIFGGYPQKSSQSAADKEAFEQLLQKLHLQKEATGSALPMNVSLQPKTLGSDLQKVKPLSPTEKILQFHPEHLEEVRHLVRNPQALQDLANQRQIASSQPTLRPPEQMLHDLVVQRSNALSQSSQRQDQSQTRNKNTEFLMGLMQSAKAAPEPQRSEQLLMRQQPVQIMKPMDRQLQQQMMDRDAEFQREVAQHEAAAQRERGASQRQARPPPPPGFFDDPAFQRGPPQQHDNRQVSNPPQPKQILQRPPPPGLDQMHPGWAQPPVQLQHPQQQPSRQHIAPPPGLASGPGRGMPMQQQQPMFLPGFPGNFHPPEIMAGPPRHMPMQPPPGFFNPPPPGFMPPGLGGFQGPDGMAFGGPFDGRGPPPPQGAFRRQ